MATEAEKAYLAGIIDADGCIGASVSATRKAGGVPQVKFIVYIKMADREAVDLAHSLYGGSLIRETPKKIGHKPLYKWQVYGKRAITCLNDVKSYLRVKQRQADTFIAARDTYGAGGPMKGFKSAVCPPRADLVRRVEYANRIKQLNQRANI